MKVTTIKKGGPHWAKQLVAYNQFKRNFPNMVGALAVSFYKESFRRAGFIDDAGLEKWEARKKEGKRKGRAILVDSGRTRRSIRVLRTIPGLVAVGTDVPYAQAHNEGAKITSTASIGQHTRKAYTRKVKKKKQTVSAATVKAHSRKMNTTIPQRRFIGSSAFLNRRITMQLNYKITNILKL